ncbi:MAG: response regulator transcription factor [Clostridium sp.]|nr:response regulator transcription factor [Clostridium sp.]
MYEKILVVDDEEDIVSFIKDFLEDQGYEVLTAFNGDEAIEKVKSEPDLILLDIMMPKKDGYEVCKSIRDIVTSPIIFLSAKQEEMDKVKGLILGADDYIIKPFGIRELKARIDAHLRRERRSINTVNRSRLYFGELSIDINGREAYFKDKLISFTRREFDIVELLSMHPGQVFSKEHIYEKVWGYDAEGDSSAVAEHIKNIRAKLSSISGEKEYILTIWGVGYKWERFK